MNKWKKVGVFADCIIFAKGNERRLYDPKYKRVVLEYKKEGN